MVKSIYKDLESRMIKTTEALERDFRKLRTGRASPAILDGINADYYGTSTPLAQMASITAPEPRLLVIQPWDVQALVEIEKAILKSELSLTPQNDGKIIRINIPVLTKERREEMVKVVRKNAEDSRVSIRNIRREANEEIKKMKNEASLSEDEQVRAEGEVQKHTDKYVEQIDKLTEAKEKEVMEV